MSAACTQVQTAVGNPVQEGPLALEFSAQERPHPRRLQPFQWEDPSRATCLAHPTTLDLGRSRATCQDQPTMLHLGPSRATCLDHPTPLDLGRSRAIHLDHPTPLHLSPSRATCLVHPTASDSAQEGSLILGMCQARTVAWAGARLRH